MILNWVSILFCYVSILLGVAFFTLLERKGLSYIQSRKGPNKAGLMGIPQPLSDGVKLLLKEMTVPLAANSLPFFVAPILSMLLAFFLWLLYPSVSSFSFFKWGILYFLCVSSLNVYGTLIAGWASNSKYALLGCLRAIAQSISYEISMVMILLLPVLYSLSFNFNYIGATQSYVWFAFLLPPIFLMWFVSCVAETNRAPFDFAEGESELVSGFNIEYGGLGFTLIFLAEYMNILVMSLFTGIIFCGGAEMLNSSNDLFLAVKTFFFAFTFIWLRASFPRLRYDLLMNLTWKAFLPVSLGFFMLFFPLMFKMLIYKL